MAYLINNARVSSLTIGGVDYTSALLNWQASDASANKNGFVATNGNIELGRVPGSFDITDYDRNIFKRGTETVLSITYPSGVTEVHPRGRLYVIGVGYNPDTDTLAVEVGCRIALAVLMDKPATLYPYAPIYLDVTQRENGNINGSLVTAGKYIYQDNTGTIVSRTFYDGDTLASVQTGDFVSILGVTTLSAAPLAAAAPIPDRLRVTYSYPVSAIANANPGTPPPQINSETSRYATVFPNAVWQRVKPENGLDGVTGVTEEAPSDGATSACGNSPDAPSDNSSSSTCQYEYELVQQPYNMSVSKSQYSKTQYGGPGGQESFSERTVSGPLLEANGQYFADRMSFCRSQFATRCNPQGGCSGIISYAGSQTVLERTQTYNTYGPDGALTKRRELTYKNSLSAAKSQDWRAGVVNGVVKQFTTVSTALYLHRLVETRWYRSGNLNYEVITEFDSNAGGGGGISGSGSLSALQGVKTVTVKKSGSIVTTPLRPSSDATPTTETVEAVEQRDIFINNYVTPPSESGPYVLEDSVPVPILETNDTVRRQIVWNYVDYLTRWVKGEGFGLQIGESMREEICSNWYPGRPFRYYDQGKNKLTAMRMDACSWTADRDGSVIVMNGIWIGDSNGVVTIPNNVTGDSRPDMTGGSNTTPPAGPGAPPAVGNEDSVLSGAYAFDVNVYFNTTTTVEELIVTNPPAAASYNVDVEFAFTTWTGGLTVTGGDLLATGTLASIPLEYAGSLVTANASVVDPDLFSA